MSGDTDPQCAPQADPLGAMQDLKRSLNRMLWVLNVACVVQAIAVIVIAVKMAQLLALLPLLTLLLGPS